MNLIYLCGNYQSARTFSTRFPLAKYRGREDIKQYYKNRRKTKLDTWLDYRFNYYNKRIKKIIPSEMVDRELQRCHFPQKRDQRRYFGTIVFTRKQKLIKEGKNYVTKTIRKTRS